MLVTVGASTSPVSVVSVFSARPVVPKEAKFIVNTGVFPNAAEEELDDSDELVSLLARLDN